MKCQPTKPMRARVSKDFSKGGGSFHDSRDGQNGKIIIYKQTDSNEWSLKDVPIK